MSPPDVIALIKQGGVLYSDIRDQIQSGDALLLHHDFAAPWYGLNWYDFQINVVQEMTGAFAHIALFDRIGLGGEERVVVYESVVPKVRAVLVSATAEQGFFWLRLNAPLTKEKREAIWAEMGVNEYSKAGAVLAGADALPANEAQDPRRWCAKFVGLYADLGPRWVPTDQAMTAMNQRNARLQYVRMA
jgi:hypothetical protein